MMAFSATAASVYADNSGTNWVTAFTETYNPTLFPDSLTTPFNIPVSADMNFVGRFMLSDMNTNTNGHLRIDHVYSQVSAVPLGPSTWPMMVLGFAGVGFMAYRRSRKDQGVAVAA
jgi:hypothetical protein